MTGPKKNLSNVSVKSAHMFTFLSAIPHCADALRTGCAVQSMESQMVHKCLRWLSFEIGAHTDLVVKCASAICHLCCCNINWNFRQKRHYWKMHLILTLTLPEELK